MMINLIRSGELKSHFIESKKKLKLRFLPIFLFSTSSNEINARTSYFAVFVSKATIKMLNKDEQFAILDHELGHVKCWKSDLILFLYLISTVFIVPFLILRFFRLDYIVNIKKNAEFAADKISVELGNSQGLISLMTKKENDNHKKSSKFVLIIENFICRFYFSDRDFYPSISERIKRINEYT